MDWSDDSRALTHAQLDELLRIAKCSSDLALFYKEIDRRHQERDRVMRRAYGGAT